MVRRKLSEEERERLFELLDEGKKYREVAEELGYHAEDVKEVRRFLECRHWTLNKKIKPHNEYSDTWQRRTRA